ncbi:DUF1688 family protein [bacterium]|nr:DUF1688 family protein [bacterium]
MTTEKQSLLTELRSLSTIRNQCRKLYQMGVENKLSHLSVHEDRLTMVVEYIHKIIVDDYPNLQIPYHSRWRHFEAGGIQRQFQLQQLWKDADNLEILRRHVDLVVVSVLLDAGAGAEWKYHESATGQVHGRSEGLGIASLKMFTDGLFSSNPKQPHQVDSEALLKLSVDDLRSGFQVTNGNPMLGLEGRTALLQKLGQAMKESPQYFGSGSVRRPGNLIDWLLVGTTDKQIALPRLWQAVIEGLENVWPRDNRIILDGRNLGDAWRHSALASEGSSLNIVPFHKLSQWLTYSLLEPIGSAGFEILGLEQLTGLPEYRNGGLFLDFEVLKLKDANAAVRKHPVDSELIVEWRALTVVLLDKTAELVRNKLNKSASEFPLAKVLEAGTWKAGRRIAAEKRSGGQPPLEVLSDGTVF